MVRYWKVRKAEIPFTTPLVRTNKQKGKKQKLSSPKWGLVIFIRWLITILSIMFFFSLVFVKVIGVILVSKII